MKGQCQDARNIENTIATAKTAQNNKNYQVADALFHEALAMAEAQEDYNTQYIVLTNLITLNILQGKDEEAYSIIEKRNIISQKFDDIDTKEEFYESLPMAFIRAISGSEETIEEDLSRIKRLTERLGTDDAYATYYSLAASIYHKHKEWNKSIYNYNKFLEYIDNGLAKKPSALISDLDLLAYAYFKIKDFENSYKTYDRQLNLIETTKGRHNYEYVWGKERQAHLLAFMGRIDDGAKLYEESWNLLRDVVSRELNMIKSSERGKYWDNVKKMVWDMTSYCLAGNQFQNSMTKASYEALMFGKGFLLSAEQSIGDRVRKVGDPELSVSYAQMLEQNAHIEDLLHLNQIKDLTVAYANLDSIDRFITKELSKHDFAPLVPNTKYEDIRGALAPTEALVDFTDFLGSDKTNHYYAAFIVKPGMEFPKLVLSFKQAALDSLIELANGNYARLNDGELSQRVIDIVWKPLSNEFQDVSTVYFVPSGILHQIPIENMATIDGRALDEICNIVRLSSSRVVIGYKEKNCKPIASAMLYGDLNYDIEPEIMALNAKKTSLSPLFSMRGTEDTLRGDSIFHNLAMSAQEIKEIEKSLKASGVDVKSLQKDDGTEESFMALSGHSPDLLLMSTHGFYFSPNNVPAWSSLNGYDNTMHLSGLVMAGGNAEWLGREVPENVCGGLLTSADIAQVDLANTQLVVLSACQTGLGKTTNEGVYGLQRAFKKAGAQTLVMSLWPVSDLATKDFMVEFHRQLSKCDWDKREAFRNARNKMRHQYDDPFYWAGFVMLD